MAIKGALTVLTLVLALSLAFIYNSNNGGDNDSIGSPPPGLIVEVKPRSAKSVSEKWEMTAEFDISFDSQMIYDNLDWFVQYVSGPTPKDFMELYYPRIIKAFDYYIANKSDTETEYAIPWNNRDILVCNDGERILLKISWNYMD